MTDGKITVNIPAGQSTGTFTVAKATGKNPEGTAKFQILSLSLTEGYKIGTTKEMTLSFTPIVSTGGTMTLEGKVGDQNYANMVYVDLSNNSQMQIDRKSWNLGFYLSLIHILFHGRISQYDTFRSDKTGRDSIPARRKQTFPDITRSSRRYRPKTRRRASPTRRNRNNGYRSCSSRQNRASTPSFPTTDGRPTGNKA